MKKILVVDDDPLSVEFIKIHLESAGHQIKSACSLDEALSLTTFDELDVLVTDVKLSDGSGIDLSKKVKSQGDVLVIGATGFSRYYLEEMGSDLSVFDSILGKPLELDELSLAIN